MVISLERGAADATASLASVKFRLILPTWYRLNQVVLDKRPLNRCVLSTLHGCAPLSKLRAELALAIFMQIIKQN